MPKVTDAHREERRRQIAEGARRAFGEHGYAGATVEVLEREIGLSRGAIFSYFPSKLDLFVALAQEDQRRSSTSGSSAAGRAWYGTSSRTTRSGSACTSTRHGCCAPIPSSATAGAR